MKGLALCALAIGLTACGSVEYRDTNATVDARPECTSGPLQPGERPSARCERKQEATWSNKKSSEPFELKKSGDD